MSLLDITNHTHLYDVPTATLWRMGVSDFGLSKFKASPLGKKIAPVITDPNVRTEMQVLAKYGFAPVLALDARLAHLKPEVGIREINSQIGRWVYEEIGEGIYEVAGRTKLDGQVFSTGATFRPLPKEAFRIERLEPREVGPEYPVKGPKGYTLVSPDLSKEERTRDGNAVHVGSLADAVPYLDKGFHIRMGRKGVRPSLIAKKSLKITRLS